MKHIGISIILLLSLLTMGSKSYGQDKFPVLEDRYFSQKPPGLIPELFAPGTAMQVSGSLTAEQISSLVAYLQSQ